MSELNIVLLGPPGAGKGTQAARLAEDFGLQYIATGNMLRDAVREGTELGSKAKEYMDRGDLVPDDLIIAMIKQSLEQDDRANGFILDGFPRTERQAQALDEELGELGRTLNAALLIDVHEEAVVERLSQRRVCVKGQHNFHMSFDPPKHPERCDVDGSRLVQRDDDKPEVIQHRLAAVPREDRARDRLLRASGHPAPRGRLAQPGRGQRPDSRNARRPQARRMPSSEAADGGWADRSQDT